MEKVKKVSVWKFLDEKPGNLKTFVLDDLAVCFKDPATNQKAKTHPKWRFAEIKVSLVWFSRKLNTNSFY